MLEFIKSLAEIAAALIGFAIIMALIHFLGLIP